MHTRGTPVRLQLGLSPRRGQHTALAPARVATCTPRYLGNNSIAGVPIGLFRTNTLLIHLTLNNNAITSLPAGVFGTKGEQRYARTRRWNTASQRTTRVS